MKSESHHPGRSVPPPPLSFLLGTDIDRATNDVRDAVTRIRQDLPAASSRAGGAAARSF
jgi:multidrug efflux pump subunit AcrB